MSGDFQNGLFGCFGNCCVCICTWFCPCYVAGKIAEKVGESCILCALVMFCPIANIICRGTIRQKVREQKGIPGTFCKDILIVWCCAPCAICQEAREVNALDSMAQSMARE
jgi:Cys-rich protein (TIGR01571 family)